VVAVRKATPPAPHHTVDPLGDADVEPLHAAGDGHAVVGLDNEVKVVVHQAVVDDAEGLGAVGFQDGALEEADKVAAAEVGHIAENGHGHVGGMAGEEPRACAVGDAGLVALGLAAGAGAAAAVRRGKGKLGLAPLA